MNSSLKNEREESESHHRLTPSNSPPLDYVMGEPVRSSGSRTPEGAEEDEETTNSATSQNTSTNHLLSESAEAGIVNYSPTGGSGAVSESDIPVNTPAPPSAAYSRVILTDWLTFKASDAATPTPPEIVEFAWLVFDVASASVLEKTRHLVRPIENSPSSVPLAFLKNKLKLNDGRPLEHSKTLKQVLNEFNTACSMVAPPSICVVATASKLRDELFSEIQRKDLQFPLCFTSAVLDVSAVAQRYCSKELEHLSAFEERYHPKAIVEALTSLHSGPVVSLQEHFTSLEGCASMAEIVKILQSINPRCLAPETATTLIVTASRHSDVKGRPTGGRELGSESTLTNTTSTTNSNSASAMGRVEDLNRTLGTSLMQQGGGALQNLAALEPRTSVEFLVRMRGVPWDVSDRDVVEFVAPVCNIQCSDVHIVVNYEGRATGEVFVRLPTMALRDKCLADLHGRNLGHRWIEVFKASEGDKATFLSVKESEQLDKRGALRLRGLPYSTNEYEIVKFFTDGGFNLDINSVVLGQSRDNRLSGDAWVLLASPQIAEDARRALHKKMIGRRYIELFQSTPREVEMARKGHLPPWRGVGGMYGGSERPGPYSMPGGGTPPGMGMWGGSRGAGSGAGGRAAVGGAGIDSGGYGVHPPAVLSYHHPSSGAPVGGTGPVGQLSSSNRGSTSVQGGAGGSGTVPAAAGHTSILRLRGLPFYANENHIVDFFQGFVMAAVLPSTAPIDGRPSGEAYVEFVSADEAYRALRTRHGAMMDRRYIELFMASKQEMDLAASGLGPREIRSRIMR